MGQAIRISGDFAAIRQSLPQNRVLPTYAGLHHYYFGEKYNVDDDIWVNPADASGMYGDDAVSAAADFGADLRSPIQWTSAHYPGLTPLYFQRQAPGSATHRCVLKFPVALGPEATFIIDYLNGTNTGSGSTVAADANRCIFSFINHENTAAFKLFGSKSAGVLGVTISESTSGNLTIGDNVNIVNTAKNTTIANPAIDSRKKIGVTYSAITGEVRFIDITLGGAAEVLSDAAIGELFGTMYLGASVTDTNANSDNNGLIGGLAIYRGILPDSVILGF